VSSPENVNIAGENHSVFKTICGVATSVVIYKSGPLQNPQKEQRLRKYLNNTK
jgi:hypothetical protein